MIIQILNTKESEQYSFVHLYEKGGPLNSGGCQCSGCGCKTEESTDNE